MKYEIHFTTTVEVYIEVEAESEEEAKRKAHDKLQELKDEYNEEDIWGFHGDPEIEAVNTLPRKPKPKKRQ